MSTAHRLLSSSLLFACLSLAACSPEAGMTLTSVSPHRISARGGEAVTLHGSSFAQGAEVRLDGEVMKGVEVVSPTEIRFTAPPLFQGWMSITVSAGGDEVSLPSALEVSALDLRFVEAPPYAFSPAAGEAIVGAALGDFDGDGDPDVISCARTAPCRLFQNDGQGNLLSSPKGTSGARFPAGALDSSAVIAADFDGDGALDLFVGLGSGASGAVLANDGKATFSPAFDMPSLSPTTVAAGGDIDGDGLPDLITAHPTGEAAPLRVYENHSKRGKISFVPTMDAPTGDFTVTAIALADLDGDGRLDLVLGTPGAADGRGLRLLLGSKAGFVDAPGRLPAGADTAARAFATGDVDGDGSIDIVVVGDHRDRLFLNDGTGHFFDATSGGMPVDAAPGTSVALVDLDRDRDLDLVIGNAGAATRIYLNDGKGRFFDHTPLLPIHADATAWVGAADVDGDADLDLLILNAPPDPSAMGAPPAAARLYLSVEPKDAL